MRVSNRRRILVLGIAAAALFPACSTWGPERLEATTAQAIDSRLPAQMPFADFKSDFPNAMLVDGDESTGAWLVYAQQTCFGCRTAEGFQRSEDVYARVVHFENGRLVRIEATSAAP